MRVLIFSRTADKIQDQVSVFMVGIGLAFNNSIEEADHMVLKTESIISLKITRGPAILYADNQKDSIALTEGDRVTIKKADEGAKIIVIA